MDTPKTVEGKMSFEEFKLWLIEADKTIPLSSVEPSKYK
jgi:hypothetical protein